MIKNIKSIRPFIGAKEFSISRAFYSDLGFEERVISPDMSLFLIEGFGFYLQDAFVKDWVDNTMVFMEVADIQSFYKLLSGLNLPNKYPTVRVLPIKILPWGSECFVHDPSGILWHFGQFN